MKQATLLMVVVGVVLVCAACGSTSATDVLQQPYDAGVDAFEDATPDVDAQPDADPGLGGPCLDDGQCDDQIDCTFDVCDPNLHRCRNTPDDTRCQDTVYCNGREICDRKLGCTGGAVITCSDSDSCTVDRCVEATKECTHTPRDNDLDGDPDSHCVEKKDCDDSDPRVSSIRAEVCGNGIDDNCNGKIDEATCVYPQGDECSSPVVLSGPGTYMLSTAGTKPDYPPYRCSVPFATGDVVASITIPPGGNKDLDVWTTAPNAISTAISIQSTCGVSSTEAACSTGWTSRTRARNLPPGTYYIVVTTWNESDIELKVDLLDPTPKATNEDCATATPITPEVPFTVSIIDPKLDLSLGCYPSTGELTYSFTLAAPADVRIFQTTLVGQSGAIIGLRDAHCTDATDELRCRSGSGLPLFARNLPAGTYYITVAAWYASDFSILVRTYPATTAPADQTCATAPAATVNGTTAIDLSDHEDAIPGVCYQGAPAAAYSLSLDVASDVMLVGRFPSNEAGMLAFYNSACTASDNRYCWIDSTPVRISQRNVPPGDYRVIVGDSFGMSSVNLTTLVRPTVAPTIIASGAADTCATAVTIPETGGFFTGDTSTAKADYDNGCNFPSGVPGGAPDQVLKLVLSQNSRVVMNMDGSTYTTILDVRQGASCASASPVPGACYVGFSGPKSFLDLTLAAGTYWVVIDGYDGSAGLWNLDVRVLPP